MADTTAGSHVVITPVPALPPQPQVSLVNPLTTMLGSLWPDDLPRIRVSNVAARVNAAVQGVELEEVAPDGSDPQTSPVQAPDGRPVMHREGSWEAGVRWRPELPGGGDVLDPCAVAAPSLPSLLAQQACDAVLLREFEPVTSFYATEENIQAAKDRAERLLESRTSAKIARELWRGDLAAGASQQWSNPFLTRNGRSAIDPVVTGAAGQSPGASPPLVKQINAGAACNNVAAFGALEQAIASYGRGDRGMIHCTRRTRAVWQWLGLIDTVGGLEITDAGNIVVADAGYDGSAPAVAGNAPFTAAPALVMTGPGSATGMTEWAYATGLVALKVSEIDVDDPQVLGDVVPPMNEGVARSLNRASDQLVVIAKRYAAYTFDPAILAGVLIDHSISLTAGTGWSTALP